MTKKKLRRLTGYCTNCNHPYTDHGDRAVGWVCCHSATITSACPCPGWAEVKGKAS